MTVLIRLTALCLLTVMASLSATAQRHDRKENKKRFLAPLPATVLYAEPSAHAEDTVVYQMIEALSPLPTVAEEDADSKEGQYVLLPDAYDIHPEVMPEISDKEIAERLKTIQNRISLDYNDKVKSFIDYFAVRNRNYTRKMIARRDIYFPTFERYLAKHDMPDELKYLSIVESGLNPRARSGAGAVGLWQFITYTGRAYGLNQTEYVDERMDPEKSTEAACLFLKSLYNTFGDWQLALAAYNCGPGNVRKAIKRSGGKKTFWEIYPNLPRETRSYVPQFIAVTYIMQNYPAHNLYPEHYEYRILSDTVHINTYVNLDIFCPQLGLCTDDIYKLNPQIRYNAVSGEQTTFVMNLPTDLISHFRNNRKAICDSSCGSKIATPAESAQGGVSSPVAGKHKVQHVVKKGESVGLIAAKYGVTLAHLQSWNRISENKIYPGQKLVVWTLQKQPTVAAKTSGGTGAKKTESVYYVQPGDTLWTISKKFSGLTIEQIKKINNLSDDNIQPGQKLLLSM